jgi:hypothetical protein
MASLESARQACYDLSTFGDNVIAMAEGAKNGVGECMEALSAINAGVNDGSLATADAALQDAGLALGRAATAVESMQRAIQGFIHDKLERA